MPVIAPHPEALFGPDSVSWKVRQRAAFVPPLSGARAALLQLAHPKIAAAIAEHSYVEGDPYERVRRTGEAMATVAFGSSSDRATTLAALASIHGSVCGALPTGERYEARDPALKFFVIATLTDSHLVVEQRYARVLTYAERSELYSERLRLADAFGIPSSFVPGDLDAFREYMSEVLPALQVGDVARRVGSLVLDPTYIRLPRAAIPAYRLILADLLPREIRSGYGLEDHPKLFRVLRAGSRTVLPFLPRRLHDVFLSPRVT